MPILQKGKWFMVTVVIKFTGASPKRVMLPGGRKTEVICCLFQVTSELLSTQASPVSSSTNSLLYLPRWGNGDKLGWERLPGSSLADPEDGEPGRKADRKRRLPLPTWLFPQELQLVTCRQS